jgi:hypothetical protein
MKHIFFLALTACSGDAFVGILTEGGSPEADASEASATADGSEPIDSADAREASDDATIDAKPDAPCPTGTAACDNAIAVYCSRLKTCCNGQCAYVWANNGGAQCIAQFSTGGCPGKMVCETQCLSDIQSANCTTIKQGPSPAYIAPSCMSLWQ